MKSVNENNIHSCQVRDDTTSRSIEVYNSEIKRAEPPMISKIGHPNQSTSNSPAQLFQSPDEVKLVNRSAAELAPYTKLGLNLNP